MGEHTFPKGVIKMKSELLQQIIEKLQQTNDLALLDLILKLLHKSG